MTTESLNLLIWLIPLPPLLAFFLIVLFTNRNKALSHTVAVGAAFLSWLGSMVVFFNAIRIEHLGENPLGSAINWLATGETFLKIGVAIDPLSAVTLFFVAWTVLCIFIYSVGYHNFGQPEGDHDQKGLPPHGATETDVHGHKHGVLSIEPMYSRFFAFIGLFAFGMYTLVVSDNLLTLFVGWEIMGLCSYLLIGFWYAKPSARNAAVKAFMTTRIGDMFMLLGIAYLYAQTGTLSFHEIFFNPEVMAKLVDTQSVISGLSVAGLIGILLFLGTIGKSAQWPLHVWLPDAMEGPTPVSAMIHAATMVSAGVYMVIRMFPLMSAGMEGAALTPPMLFMAFIGAFTALFAATIAVAQNDIKRVLAFSTISQLGYMIAALGIGAYVAAAFHLVTHAFFKALLFLGSGSVIHGMEHGVLHTGDHHVDPQDMTNMGGLWKKMPVTFWTFLIGGFALSGFPLITAGFWSKDEILADAFKHAPIVFWVLALAALLTAFYTMRQITLTFFGKPRTQEAEHAHETPWTMTLPLVILAVFAIGFGWVGIPEDFPILGGIPEALGFTPNWFHHFVNSTLPAAEEHAVALKNAVVVAAEEAEAGFSYFPLITSVIVGVGGLILGWLAYRGFKAGSTDLMKKLPFGLYDLLKNKYYFDEIYDKIFIKPAFWLAERFAYLFMDRVVIDGILHGVARIMAPIGHWLREYPDKKGVNGFGDFMGEWPKSLSRQVKVVQTGKVQQYMLAGLVFAVATLFYFLLAR